MNVIAYHFWSPTCAPCNIIKPAVEDLKEEFPDVHWVPVNTHDDTYGLASKYKVSVVPTIVVIYNGDEVGRHSGTSMITYYSILRKAIALSKVTTS
jgi:thiol-disulfide isomerase/thioredoxin